MPRSPSQAAARLSVSEAKPEYTPEARAAGLQGTVSLYLEVGNNGHAADVEVMQGLGLGLDEKAVEVVKRNEYKASAVSSLAVQSRIDVDVQFRLDPPAPWSVASEVYSVIVPKGPAPRQVVNPVPSRYLAPDSAACMAAGRAVVKFLIGKDGRPRGVVGGEVEAAARAVEGWQFAPATLDGRPAEANAEVEFECRPEGMILLIEMPKAPVYRVGGGVSAPVILSKVEPRYSEAARQAKIQGSARIALQVSTDGRVTHMVVVQPLGFGLDEKAMEGLKRWRFTPGMKDGKPVTVEATIEVNFRLL